MKYAWNSIRSFNFACKLTLENKFIFLLQTFLWGVSCFSFCNGRASQTLYRNLWCLRGGHRKCLCDVLSHVETHVIALNFITLREIVFTGEFLLLKLLYQQKKKAKCPVSRSSCSSFINGCRFSPKSGWKLKRAKTQKSESVRKKKMYMLLVDLHR